MSTQTSEKKEPDVFSGRLIDLLGEVRLSYLTEEIPETDLERMSVEQIRAESSEKMAGERIREQEPGEERTSRRPQRVGWKRVAVLSGFAAAGSAAVTGIIVFACMRHSYSSVGAK
ncbi:MAG: hypothetical protein LUG99_12660 [Lachnospiraceae bacterium]|nr:hypothetical protein [Lachnospiraceae bacterium]